MNLLKSLLPPPEWILFAIISTGILIGLLAYIIHTSNAASYLSDDPKTCINCHIMAPQYATWNHSSHREVASCNDCHVPHNNIANKYFYKAKDGMRHAAIFTLRLEPQVIFIGEGSTKVVHENCIRCHTDQICAPNLVANVKDHKNHMQNRKCWECHKEVPHGRVNSLASTPNARIYESEKNMPKWLENQLNKE